MCIRERVKKGTSTGVWFEPNSTGELWRENPITELSPLRHELGFFCPYVSKSLVVSLFPGAGITSKAFPCDMATVGQRPFSEEGHSYNPRLKLTHMGVLARLKGSARGTNII